METAEVKNPPAFQFYPQDYLSDENVALMSLAAQGAYVRLLCYCWISDGLPAESEKLARLACCSVEEWESIAPDVRPCFVENGDGRLHHPRLQAEKAKQEAWRAKSAKGGRASAKARKGGSRVVEPKANTSSSTSSSSSKTTGAGAGAPPSWSIEAYEIPEGAEGCADALQEWLDYRKAARLGKYTTSKWITKAWNDCQHSSTRLRAAVENSMAREYKGIFEEGPKGGRTTAADERRNAGKEEGDRYGHLGFE